MVKERLTCLREGRACSEGVVGCAHLPARDRAAPKSAQPSPTLPGSQSHPVLGIGEVPVLRNKVAS